MDIDEIKKYNFDETNGEFCSSTQFNFRRILEAVSGGNCYPDTDLIEQLNQKISNLSVENIKHATPCYSPNPQDIDSLQAMINSGEYVIDEVDGETALTTAVSANAVDVVKLLLNNKANPNLRGKRMECSALMEAANAGYTEIVRLLLEHGASTKLRSNTENTALHYAAAAGHLDCVRLLLKYDAPLEDQNETGHTPLMEATSNGHIEIARCLIEAGADIDTYSTEFKESALTLASYKGHAEMVKFLLDAGADHEHRTDETHTALMEAAMEGHVEVARLLLAHGASVSIPQDSFESSLTLAACGGHTELCHLLIGYEADIEEANDEGYTPLMEASREGHEETVALLLACGADVNAKTEETQETALTLAACGGFVEVCDMLIKTGANIEVDGAECSTPLMEAAQEGHVTLVRRLLELGANVNAVTATNDTALHYAAENGHVKVCKSLLLRNASCEAKAEGGRTPLMKAARAGHLETVQLLVEWGAQVDATTTQNDATALSLACNGGHAPVVEYLLTNGADPRIQLRDGCTMLIEAARSGNREVMRLILDYPRSLQPPSAGPCMETECVAQEAPVSYPTLTPSVEEELALPAATDVQATRSGQLVSSLLSTTTTATPPLPPPHHEASSTLPFTLPKTSHQLNVALANAFAAGWAQGAAQSVQSRQSKALTAQQIALFMNTGLNALLVGNPGSSELGAPGMKGGSDLADLRGLLNGVAVGEETTEEEEEEEEEVDRSSDEEILINPRSKLARASTRRAPVQQPNCLHDPASEDWVQLVNSLVSDTDKFAKDLATRLAHTDGAGETPGANGQAVRLSRALVAGLEELAAFLRGQQSEGAEVVNVADVLRPHARNLRLSRTCSSPSLHSSSAVVTPNSGRDGDGAETPLSTASASSRKADSSKRALSRKPALGRSVSAEGISEPHSQTHRSIHGHHHYHPHHHYVRQQLQASNNNLPGPIDYSSAQMKQIFSNLFIGDYDSRQDNANSFEQPSLSADVTPAAADLLPFQSTLDYGGVAKSSSAYHQHLLHNGGISSSIGDWLMPDYLDLGLSRAADKASVASLPSQSLAAMGPAAAPADMPELAAATDLLPNIDVNACTESNMETALTLACNGGFVDLVRLLLERGADKEHRDKKSHSPLHTAVLANQRACVALLLDFGADIEAQVERTKDTALSIACSHGRLEIVEELLSRGANKEHRNISDYTPLSMAASSGYVEVIELLLRHGAEINSRTGSKLGISPLMLASMNGHTAAVKVLLDSGSDINAHIETNRNTALTLACFQGRHEVVQLLVDRKANIEHRAKTGLTPLMEAASGDYVEVGMILLRAGADVNAIPVLSSRDTALTIAADKGNLKFVHLLLENCAIVEARNKKGATPLWLACNGGHYDVVKILITFHADVNSQDNRRVSCLMAAFRKGHVNIVNLLVLHVSQFPSDKDCTRHIKSIVNDNELVKRCQQCCDIIISAKEKQDSEAKKNAECLLDEIDLEEEERANKEALQAKKRAKKKAKKKAKQVKDKLDKQADSPEPTAPASAVSATPSTTSSASLIKCSLVNGIDRIMEEYDLGISKPSPAEKSARAKKPQESGSTDTNNNNQSAAAKTAAAAAAKKKSPTPPPSTTTATQPRPVADSMAAASTEESTESKRQKHRSKKLSQRNAKRVEKQQKQEQQEEEEAAATQTSTHLISEDMYELMAANSDEEGWCSLVENKFADGGGAGGSNDSWKVAGSAKTAQPSAPAIDEWRQLPGQSAAAAAASAASGAAAGSTGLAGAASITVSASASASTAIASSTKKRLTLPISRHDIGKVIGQGGAVVSALRVMSGIQIDIESSRGEEVSERMVHLKGPADVVQHTQDIIQALASGLLAGNDVLTRHAHFKKVGKTGAISGLSLNLLVHGPDAAATKTSASAQTPKSALTISLAAAAASAAPAKKAAPKQQQQQQSTGKQPMAAAGTVNWIKPTQKPTNFAAVAASGVVSAEAPSTGAAGKRVRVSKESPPKSATSSSPAGQEEQRISPVGGLQPLMAGDSFGLGGTASIAEQLTQPLMLDLTGDAQLASVHAPEATPSAGLATSAGSLGTAVSQPASSAVPTLTPTSIRTFDRAPGSERSQIRSAATTAPPPPPRMDTHALVEGLAAAPSTTVASTSSQATLSPAPQPLITPTKRAVISPQQASNGELKSNGLLLENGIHVPTESNYDHLLMNSLPSGNFVDVLSQHNQQQRMRPASLVDSFAAPGHQFLGQAPFQTVAPGSRGSSRPLLPGGMRVTDFDNPLGVESAGSGALFRAPMPPATSSAFSLSAAGFPVSQSGAHPRPPPPPPQAPPQPSAEQAFDSFGLAPAAPPALTSMPPPPMVPIGAERRRQFDQFGKAPPQPAPPQPSLWQQMSPKSHAQKRCAYGATGQSAGFFPGSSQDFFPQWSTPFGAPGRPVVSQPGQQAPPPPQQQQQQPGSWHSASLAPHPTHLAPPHLLSRPPPALNGLSSLELSAKLGLHGGAAAGSSEGPF